LAEAGSDALSAANWAQSRKVLDLDDLAFSQGSHFMSNKTCALPKGSTQKQTKSYAVISVPALKPKPFDENEKLIPINELPKWARPGFNDFRALNRIQSRISKAALKSDGNLLICAPTVSSKTLNCLYNPSI
jgi:pre-mRNA-splicing helicase BRR2